MQRQGLTYFSVIFLETDLWIGVDTRSFHPAMQQITLEKVKALRREMDAYLERQPSFLHSLAPLAPLPGAPELAQVMASAACAGNVGPMAAVAGAFAETIGSFLLSELRAQECLVENGGDIFLSTRQNARIGIFAGKSPLSGKLSLFVDKKSMPMGVCTSAGSVGPSLSLGCTDATVALCSSAALADAYATTLGNLVKSPDDIEPALAVAQKLPELKGCVIILGDRIGAWGEVELQPL